MSALLDPQGYDSDPQGQEGDPQGQEGDPQGQEGELHGYLSALLQFPLLYALHTLLQVMQDGPTITLQGLL